MKLAVAQMCSMDDFESNLKIILELIERAAAEKAEILFFPENCLYMRLDKKVLPPYIEAGSPYLSEIYASSKKNKIAIHLGGVGYLSKGEGVNASLFCSPENDFECTYKKQKLFDIDLRGKHSYRESDAYRHGKKNEVLHYASWRFGQSICYDLRFSEIYHEYALQNVDAILIPSSFLVPTGKAHWHILNRARAIESQAYVISATQAGDHKGRHQSFGHSLVIDPWGEVLIDLEDQINSIGVVEIHKNKIQQVREQMPMRLGVKSE